MTAARQLVQVSPPTFTPDPGCIYRPIYDLALDLAASLAYDDGDLMRPPTIPAESVEEALAAGYVLLATELLEADPADPDGDNFIALPADDLHRICVEAVLSQRGSTGELLAAHKALDDARRLHAMSDPEDEPYLFQAVEQSEGLAELRGVLLREHG